MSSVDSELPVSSAAHDVISAWMSFVLAAAAAIIVANIYYAQPLAGPISQALGISPKAAGLIVTMTQIGYGLGLLLIVPLGDLFENRRLILIVSGVCTLALVIAGLATHAVAFMGAAFLIGVSAVAVQIIVPFASHLAPEAMRGRVVGNIMSGLMLGIMLARPVASFIAQISSWHTVFFISAVMMVLLMAVLARTLPQRFPASKIGYGKLLLSMGHLAIHTPVLQRRALYHACMFGAFSLFWTTTPLLLAGPHYKMSQAGIALFALAGVAGAVSAPIAGRLADKGFTRVATGLAMFAVAGAFLLTHIGELGSTLTLAMLVVAAIVIDFGATANLVLGQRAIYTLSAEHRSRLNGLYMATFFAGGAVGSALGGWAYAQSGWPLTSFFGLALPVLAFIYYCTEFL